MVLGLVQYVFGAKYLGNAGLYPAPAASPDAAARLRRSVTVWGGVALVALAAIGFGMATGVLPIMASQVADAAGYMLLVIVVAFFGWLFFVGDWTPIERKRLYAIGVLFVASAIFWSEFEQAGSTLNVFGDRATRTSVFGWTFPRRYSQSLQPLCF